MSDMNDATTEMRDYAVHDGDLVYHFEGVLLGRASSETPGKKRWSEIAIYRTAAGTYVVEGIGRSVNDGEHDIKWARICESTQCVVDRMYMHSDSDGTKYIPRVNRTCIEQAGESDTDIKDAFVTQTID